MANSKGDVSSRMGWKHYDDLLPSKTKCRTGKIIEEYVFNWTIENLNFMIMGEDPGYSIKSPLFPCDMDKLYKWTVQFLPLGTKACNYSAFVIINLESGPKVPSKMKCEVMFRDMIGNKLMEEPVKGTNHFTENTMDQKLYLMTSLEIVSKILPLEKENQDVLNIEVKITCAVKNSEEYLETKESSPQELVSALNLIEDLSKLLKNEPSSDIVVKVKNTAFHAHKAILTARSPVLAAMLQHETKEKHEKVIHINDIKADVMEKILRFLYTSRIKYNDMNEAKHILEVAEKYDIQNLKMLCEDYLVSKLNTGNILNILNVANLHNAQKLKAKSIDFICENRDNFTNPESYANAGIQDSKLLMEVAAAMASASKQNIKS